LALVVALITGCASARYIQTGMSLPPKPDDCDIEVFSSKLPERDYDELGIIEGEGSFGADSLEDVLPKMMIEACRAGGDALILNSSDRFSTDVDDTRLAAMATVVRWTN